MATFASSSFGALALAACSMAYADTEFHPAGDLFDKAPPAAIASASCKTAQTYMDLINAGKYDQLSNLFAENAVFLTPIGKVLHGQKQIGDFYSGMLNKLVPKVIPISFIADGHACVMEIAAQTVSSTEGYRLSAIDHFTLDPHGKIVHMVVYLRPDSGAPKPGEEATGARRGSQSGRVHS